MKYRDYIKLDEFYEQLPKGSFLTVSDGENINVMTIGWAATGIMWNKPYIILAVRKSRHTYDILKGAKDFTISTPLKADLKDALMLCGTKSGRDIDKFKEANLKTDKSRSVETPIITNCELHYEFKLMYSMEMDKDNLSDEVKKSFYKEPDYHLFYFGELLEAYEIPLK